MAGTNDFVQHNPTEANQEPTTDFAADSLTTGGIGTDAIMPSPWMNARWYQDSTVCAALMQMLATKNYNVSVANLATLASVFANIVTEADLRTPLVSVGYSPTPTFPASTANGFDIVLGGNVTSSSFNATPNIGQILTFIVTQTSGGGATFVPPSTVNGWQPINTAPNSVTVQQFIVKEDGTIWSVTPIRRTVIVDKTSINVPNTTYQNTSGVPMSLSGAILTATGGSVGNIAIEIGSTSGLGIALFVNQATATVVGGSAGFSGAGIPAGWFYRVATSGAVNGSVQSWIESYQF